LLDISNVSVDVAPAIFFLVIIKMAQGAWHKAEGKKKYD